MTSNSNFNLSCPSPIQPNPHILLAHGGGGRLMHQLIEQVIIPSFANETLNTRQDAAVIEINNQRLAFTTDSFVVHPLFFPGGDIGSLAVNGTVNDLAMVGAQPLYLSVSFILEEGLSLDIFQAIVSSMKEAAQQTKVEIITGDTKVVNHGKGDSIFINTTGIGIIKHSQTITPKQVQVGDIVLLNGDLGRHGIAILAVREGLEFETTITSDSMPLAEMVLALIEAGIQIRCLRDLTRGGLASALNEIALVAGVEITIAEANIPVQSEVQGACELLGFDPLYVANEGRFIAFVPEQDAERALAVLHSFQAKNKDFNGNHENPCIIGQVTKNSTGLVKIRNKIGTHRIVDMLSGEQLPRIC